MEVYFRGHTVVQAAEVLGIPAGTARSRLFYPTRAMREAFADPKDLIGS
jgi:RNA polymerase sigma-70 factor (ECF subfamily)